MVKSKSNYIDPLGSERTSLYLFLHYSQKWKDHTVFVVEMDMLIDPVIIVSIFRGPFFGERQPND